MAGTVRVSRETIVQAMQSSAVREALKAKADSILVAAQAIASETPEVSDAKIWVAEGTRPKGRPFAQVVCDDVEQEHGSMRKPKIRLLGKAAGKG